MSDLWNVGDLQTREGNLPTGSIYKPIAFWSLSAGALSYFGSIPVALGAIGAGAATVGMNRYLSARKKLIDAQLAYWSGIFQTSHLKNCAFIGGGDGTLDLVRADQVPGSVKAQLLRAVYPIIAEALFSTYENKIDALPPFIPEKPIHTISNLLAQYSSYAVRHRVSGGRIIFKNDASLSDRPLLLTLGGPVSHSLACQHLIATNPLRKYHIQAILPLVKQRIRFKDLEEIERLRELKRRIASEAPPDQSGPFGSADAFLDTHVQYELIMGNERVRPHHLSSKSTTELHDLILIIFSRAPESVQNRRENRWLLSIHPFHALGGVSIDLYWHPLRFLGKKQATEFRKHALKAMNLPGSRGFEAVLQVSCRKTSALDSPRVFRNLPSLDQVSVKLIGLPKALRD
jgi:hypothetical protein